MKQKLIKYLAVFAYHSGLCSLFYWLNRKAKRIITFHNVLPDAMFRTGVANGVSSRLSDFEKTVDECSKRFEFSTDLFDAKTLTITFDDGYRNQYTTAFMALRKRGIPAYLFVAGGCLNGKALVVDLLTHWIDNVPDGIYKLELNGMHEECSIASPNRAKVWEDVVWPMFLADKANLGEGILSSCEKAYPLSEILEGLPEDYRLERLKGVTIEECEEMKKYGWKIGWHTKSHYPLSGLDADRLNDELDSPHGFRDVCLSYPYGNPSEVGDAAIGLAEAKGYPCAVSNTNSAAENCSRYFLPRMALSSDRYMLHFELSGIKYFIKHGAFLPRQEI